MQTSLILAVFVESVLILLTLLLLVQPNKVLSLKTERGKAVAWWAGLFFLVMTFLWSIIFGIVLSVNGISIHS